MFKKMKLKLILYFFLCCSVFSCGHPLKYFYDEIKKYGYIQYTTPLRYAGTGTLIGGTPQSMEIIAHPDTCFQESGWSKLRYKDESVLPNSYENLMVDAKASGSFFKALGNASPSIKAGINIKAVHKINFELEGVHVEYMDSIKLVDYYNNQMSDICKEYLNYVGFIIQAIKVDQLNFTFYKKDGGRFTLDLENIKQFLDLSADVKWEIEKGVTLVIKTPKYIGYQLASLRKNSNGFSLYRASEYKRDKWIFKEIGVFDDKNSDNMAVNVLDNDHQSLFFKTLEQLK